jgi:hypothetical protein
LDDLFGSIENDSTSVPQDLDEVCRNSLLSENPNEVVKP